MDHSSPLRPAPVAPMTPGLAGFGTAPGASAGASAPRRPLARRSARGAPTFRAWSKHIDAVRGSLFAITLVSISAVHMYLGPLKYMRPTVTLLALACVAAFLNRKAMAWSQLTRAWPSRLVLWLFVISCLSAFGGLSFGGSAFYITDRYIKVLIVFFLTVAAIRNARDLALMTWSYVISIGVLQILAATVLEMEVTMQGLGRMEGGQTMYDANDLGMLLVMALPTAILTYFNSARLGRAVSLAVIGGIPIVLALTGSRGAMIGLAVLAPVLFVSLRRVRIATRLGTVVALVVGIALGAPDGYWKQMSTILDPAEDYNVSSDYGRIGIAKRGVHYMVTRPLLGVGINNFNRAEGTISPIAAERLNNGLAVEWIAPHNTYVQVGAELGVFGMAIWLALLFGGTIGLWRTYRRIPASWSHESADRRFLRDACLFLPGSFIGFAVTSFFLSHAYTPPPYILFALLAGLVASVERELKADRMRAREAAFAR